MEYTRPATWEDVKSIARALEEAGAEYALVGGYALAAHGFARFTEDVDLLVNPSAANARLWIVALSQMPDGAARELAQNPDVFANDQRYAVRINDEITVDIMPSIAGLSWNDMVPHITSIAIDGQSIRLLDLAGLLKTKQGARPKDKMDAQVIQAALAALKA